MAKIYPPQLDSKIPAQTGTELKIPFQFNRGVDKNSIKALVLLIKTVSTNKEVGTFYLPIESNANLDTTNAPLYVAKFRITNLDQILKIGQFYKIQLACSSDLPDSNGVIVDSKIGYYSSVGAFKYTALAQLGLQEEEYLVSYQGTYIQNQKGIKDNVVVDISDITEKVYEYQFDLYNADTNELCLSSGKQLHNSSNTLETNSSYDIWNIEEDLDTSLNYKLKYTIYTVNQLIQTTELVINAISEDPTLPELNYTLETEYDFENGRVLLFLIGNSFIKNNVYRISRASSDNVNKWVTLKDYKVPVSSSVKNNRVLIFEDYTVEQGITYIYGVQQITYNSNGTISTTTKKKISQNIYVDFEDIFLYDGERQLRIRFNPKVTSFKTVIKDTKIETLGGQFPFIFRSGNVSYQTFPIGGLISYLMDDNELFITKNNIGFFGVEPKRNETVSAQTDFNIKFNTSNLDKYNIYSERKFKNEVMQWLNNGNIKLFRSPVEGNYLVRLMDVNLTPNDTLGRMLHSFTCNAHEVAAYNTLNLKQYILNQKE